MEFQKPYFVLAEIGGTKILGEIDLRHVGMVMLNPSGNADVMIDGAMVSTSIPFKEMNRHWKNCVDPQQIITLQ